MIRCVKQPDPLRGIDSIVYIHSGNAIQFEDAILRTAAGFVGDNALVVGVVSSPGRSVAVTRAFLLQGDMWVEQTNFTVPESSTTSRLVTTSFFHTTNSTVVAYGHEGDSFGTPRRYHHRLSRALTEWQLVIGDQDLLWRSLS